MLQVSRSVLLTCLDCRYESISRFMFLVSNLGTRYDHL